MNVKDNQRTRLTKMLLKNALMDILKEKGSIDKIKVNEICLKAEINRSTFYAHYVEPKEILEEIENELIHATEDHLEKIGAEDDTGAHRYLQEFLKFIKENDKQFRVLLIDSYDLNFKTKFMNQTITQFVDNLNVILPPNLEQYVYSYILNGSMGILIQWIRSDYSVSEEEIVNLLFSINQSALINLSI